MEFNLQTGRWEDSVEAVRFFGTSAMSITTSLFTGESMTMGGPPGMHFHMVKDFRLKFKKYSKEDFRSMSKTPLVKDMLSGLTKLNKEEIQERIKHHLESME